jgi:hypothetical protein
MLFAASLPHASEGFTLTFFPASVWSEDTTAMDEVLGVRGLFIEDFEDTTLISGLSIAYTGNGFNQTQTGLVQTLDFSFDASWDGKSVTSNDPNNNVPPDSGVPWAQITTFKFAQGATIIGIALSGFQSTNPPSDFPITNHRLYINGVAFSSDIEALAGTNWTSARSLRNAYLRIDAGAGEVINSVGFENISGNDFLHFDHLALRPLATNVTVTPNVAIWRAVEIGWPSERSTSYQVQWAPDPQYTNSWFNLGGAVPGNGSTNYIFDTTRTAEKRFYRVLRLH